MSSDFDGWRKKIDEIDLQLLELLNKRSRCAMEIGKIKKKKNLPAWSPEREAEIHKQISAANQGPLGDAAVRRLFERIIDEARSLERHAMDRDFPSDEGTQGSKEKG